MYLQAGDILVFRNNSFFNKLTRAVFGTWGGHIGICCGNNYIIEAEPGGVKKRLITYYFSPIYNYDVYRYKYDLTDVQKVRIQTFLHARIGDAYDYMGVLFLFVTHLVNRNWRNILEGSRYWFCTELVATAYRVADIDLFDGRDPSQIGIKEFEINPYLKKIGVAV